MADLPPLPSDIELGTYQHYKGDYYVVIGFARHSETLEPLVIYRRLDVRIPDLWARPASMWNELVDGKPRFERMPEHATAKEPV